MTSQNFFGGNDEFEFETRFNSTTGTNDCTRRNDRGRSFPWSIEYDCLDGTICLTRVHASRSLYLFIMRALGEMVYTHPHSGSYAKFANDYIHPAAGFLTASSNIFNWVVVGMSEVIAVGTYLRFWWPELPTWIPGVVVIILLTLANLASVKMFGELEFWFASIKVITILLMIVAGLGIIFFGLGNDGNPVGFSNLWANGGFFTNGFTGFFFALSIVFASYIGVELIGVTAGETKDPEKNITKAINGVVWRILIFYVGSIFIIVTVYPWNELSDLGSPFVATFAKVGVTIAAGIINFVVITAALSGCNSGIFSASRMIYALAEKGQVPSFFLKVNKRGIPFYTVFAISIGIFFESFSISPCHSFSGRIRISSCMSTVLRYCQGWCHGSRF